MKIIIATVKSWNITRAQALRKQYEGVHDIRIFTTKEELTPDAIQAFCPDYILLPHWSYLIPEEITDRWECVVFHMTDLPYGRGGSPLQNLIVRGHKDTMVSAIKVTKKLDGGPVYMKRPLSLAGSAQEIYERCSDIIFGEMIPCFFSEPPEPVPQTGEPVVFRRRKPEEGRLTPDMAPETLYDYIRMLDAEGYPRAYMEFGDYRLEFDAARLDQDGQGLEAHVKIRKTGVSI